MLPVQANHPVTLYPHVNSASGVAPTGTIAWRDADSDTVIATLPASDAVLSFSSLPVGTHNFVADYSGDEVHASATSDVFALNVVADQVDASNVGVEFTTFYPVDDDYRDTVAIRGTRNESISVSIKITSPTGSSVKSK